MQGNAVKNHYTHSDSDPQCLPRTGTTGPANPTAQYGNLLYDMQLAGSTPPGLTYTGNPKVRCAICAAPRPYCVQMVGTSACPAGFINQYSGYLYSNYYTAHGGSSPICLDIANIDQGAGTGTDQAGYIYPVINHGTLTATPSTQFVQCRLCCLP
jgi:hypothetical protein